MIEPRNTPCSQSNASRTSGTTVARRPPNRIASIGTPAGSSHSGAIDGHCAAGVVKRAFGCAAGRVRRPASSRRRASRSACAGGSSVMPSHQTSPSSVSAQLVKIELLADRRHRVRVRLLARARRDAEEAGLGVDRVQAAVRRRTSSRRCRRRSSRPSSPGASGSASRGSSCRRPTGTRPRRTSSSPSGEVSLRISMCSAIQPSSRAITEAIRSAKHFLPSSALPP